MNDTLKSLLEGLTPEQKQKLTEDLLSSREDEASDADSPKPSPHPKVKEDFSVNREQEDKSRKGPVKFQKNQWTDEGEDRDADFDYQKFDKMKTPRKRGKPNKIMVECHICGKNFHINQNLVYGEFIRCNTCTGR
jgi:formylmethanofuran dehydrogenase subunit E